MARKNHRNTGRPQRSRRYDGLPTIKRLPPAPIEQMIVPRGRCHLPHRKLRFTAEEADKALRQAQHGRKVRGSGHAEERHYECKVDEGGCGDWHLTSRTTFVRRGEES